MSATSTQTSPPEDLASAGETTQTLRGPVLGTMTFADTVDAATAAQIVETALQGGVRAIDTANVYAGGRTEELLASLLVGRREQVHLASKVGMPHEDAGDAAPLSAAAIHACVNGSLRRLGVDSLDLLYLHQPDRSTPLEETFTAVAELFERGVVSSWGLSNFSAWRVVDADRAAQGLGLPPVAAVQQLHNLVARRLEEEYVDLALSRELTTVVYNPLAGGLLSGRHRAGVQPTEGRFADSRLSAMYLQRYWDEQILTVVEQLRSIAEQAGIPMVELALRWVVSRPSTSAVLLGASRTEHLRANLAALAAGPLPADVVAACDQATNALNAHAPAYAR